MARESEREMWYLRSKIKNDCNCVIQKNKNSQTARSGDSTVHDHTWKQLNSHILLFVALFQKSWWPQKKIFFGCQVGPWKKSRMDRQDSAPVLAVLQLSMSCRSILDLSVYLPRGNQKIRVFTSRFSNRDRDRDAYKTRLTEPVLRFWCKCFDIYLDKHRGFILLRANYCNDNQSKP